MKKKIQIVSLVAIVVVLGGWYLVPRLFQNHKNEGPVEATPKAPEGKTSEKSRGGGALNVLAYITRPTHLQEKIKVNGNILPDEQVELSFETSGKIVGIYFTEGTSVKKGQLLAKANDAPLQAQLLKLKAQRKLAEDRLFRQRALLDKDAVSKETYETVFTNLETINADIQLVEANISLTELRAPFDGVVGLRLVSEGAFATPTTIVTRLAKEDRLKVEFSVPEVYADQIPEGMTVKFTMQGSLKTYTAKVYAKDSKLNDNTKTLDIRALYNNERHTIVPGRFASVEIDFAEIRDAIAVPSEAIIPEMGKDMVYLYRSGKAEPVQVKTGLRTPSQIQISEGLQVGDTVVTSGILQLRKGLPLKLDGIIINE